MDMDRDRGGCTSSRSRRRWNRERPRVGVQPCRVDEHAADQVQAPGLGLLGRRSLQDGVPCTQACIQRHRSHHPGRGRRYELCRLLKLPDRRDGALRHGGLRLLCAACLLRLLRLLLLAVLLQPRHKHRRRRRDSDPPITLPRLCGQMLCRETGKVVLFILGVVIVVVVVRQRHVAVRVVPPAPKRCCRRRLCVLLWWQCLGLGRHWWRRTAVEQHLKHDAIRNGFLILKVY